MFTTVRESYLFREGFKTTSELFALLGRNEMSYCNNWGRFSMGLQSGGRGSCSDREIEKGNMEFWYWRRRYRQENIFGKGIYIYKGNKGSL